MKCRQNPTLSVQPFHFVSLVMNTFASLRIMSDYIARLAYIF